MDSIPEVEPRKCEGCHETFTPDKYEEQRNPQRYCSQECYHEHSPHFLTKMTDEERKEFLAKRSAVRRANYETQKQEHFAERQCGNCGNPFWVNKYRAEHFNVSYCSKKCRNAKRSETHFSKVKSPEEVKQIYHESGKKRRAHYHPEGIPRSLETRKKMREKALGRDYSWVDQSFRQIPEYRAKLRETQTRHLQSVAQVCQWLESQGYQTLMLDHIRPDILALKDGNFSWYEVERTVHGNIHKYDNQNIIKNVQWIAVTDAAERRLTMYDIPHARLNLGIPEPLADEPSASAKTRVSNL